MVQAKNKQPKPAERRFPSAATDSYMVITDREFQQLRDLIHAHTGIALSEHKRALICSRLGRRLRHHGLSSYTEYYKQLTQDDLHGDELVAMINAITTNKTEFFREPHHFRFLGEEVFPAHRRTPNRERPMRLWSAGSSTGEEAYSLAMTALEAMPSFNRQDIHILATDIDTDVLARAKNGIYTQEQAARIPESLLHRYFLKGQGEHKGQVMAKPLLKALIHFERLNLLDNPWSVQGPFDVIMCRNVLIYFDKAMQQNLLKRMGTMLKKEGYLMLGHSEAMHGFNDIFKPISHSIYQYRGKS